MFYKGEILKKYEQEVEFYYNKWHKILEDTGTIFENEVEIKNGK